MARVIVLLSGPIAAGKTTLCDELVNRFGFHVCKTRELIHALLKDVPMERAALQKAGEALDRKSKGEWVAKALGQKVQELRRDQNIVVDSARIKNQIDGVRRAFGPQVIHIHLTAPLALLEKRYETRRRKAHIKELPSYAEARKDPTEQQVEKLAACSGPRFLDKKEPLP